MNYTANYRLPQWVEDDRILMEDFNQMCRNIESGLEKVKKEGSDEMQSLTEALQQLIGSGGSNCRLEMGSYTGNGKYGKANAVELQFSIRPILILIGSHDNAPTGTFPSVLMRGIDRSHSDSSNSPMQLEWTDTSVKMWVTDKDYSTWMNNTDGCQYFYVALGC